MCFASADRQAAQVLNEVAYAARKVFGTDHPQAALIAQISLLTDQLVDEIAPITAAGGA